MVGWLVGCLVTYTHTCGLKIGEGHGIVLISNKRTFPWLSCLIGLIGWFTWQLMDRLKDVQARIEAVEGSLSNPTDSDE